MHCLVCTWSFCNFLCCSPFDCMPKKYSSSQPARLFLKCSELKPLPLLPYAILFLVCRLAESSRSFEDGAPAGTHSDSPAFRLQQQLHLWGKRREEVPSDGHCLIHAWLRVSQWFALTVCWTTYLVIYFILSWKLLMRKEVCQLSVKIPFLSYQLFFTDVSKFFFRRFPIPRTFDCFQSVTADEHYRTFRQPYDYCR